MRKHKRAGNDLTMLVNDLRVIFRATINSSADRVATQQAQYSLALVKIAHFFEQRAGDDIARKFVELADAIGGLRKGTVAGPVRPALAFGRGPDLHMVWGLRADVCTALECFVMAGESRDKAAGEIAKKYPVLERLKRKASASLKGSILSWRKHLIPFLHQSELTI